MDYDIAPPGATLRRRFGPAWGFDPMKPLVGTLTVYRDRIDAKWLRAFECLDLDALIAARQRPKD